MSSKTTYQVKTVTTYQFSKDQVLPLYEILGEGGCRMLTDTLRDIEKLRKRVGDDAGQYNWSQVSNKTYEIETHGIRVRLYLGKESAEIGYDVTTQNAAQYSELKDKAGNIATRTFNNLLCLGISNQMAEHIHKMQIQQTQKARVEPAMRIGQQNTIHSTLRMQEFVAMRRS